MNNIDELKIIFDKNNEFIKSKNYYFETHMCGDVSKKVNMDYSIEYAKSAKKVVFGKCESCNKVFYNEG